MVSSGMLRRVALVRTDVSEEPGASNIRVTRRNIPEDTIRHGVCFLDVSQMTAPVAANGLPTTD
jgi:hypothetical protein